MQSFGLGSIMVSDLIMDTSSIMMRKCLDLTGFLTRIIPATALALFCTLVRLLSLHLRSIRIQIEQDFNSLKLSNVLLTESNRLQLKILKKQHILIYKATRQLNQCFGMFLALEVSYVFVGVITSAMFFLMGATSENWMVGLLNISVFVEQVCHLYFLTSYTESVATEVWFSFFTIHFPH